MTSSRTIKHMSCTSSKKRHSLTKNKVSLICPGQKNFTSFSFLFTSVISLHFHINITYRLGNMPIEAFPSFRSKSPISFENRVFADVPLRQTRSPQAQKLLRWSSENRCAFLFDPQGLLHFGKQAAASGNRMEFKSDAIPVSKTMNSTRYTTMLCDSDDHYLWSILCSIWCKEFKNVRSLRSRALTDVEIPFFAILPHVLRLRKC